jgi:hypothetical protein
MVIFFFQTDGGGRLGGTGAVGGRGVDERGSGVFDAKGTEASEESGDVARVGDSEGVVGAVVLEGETEEFGSMGVGFDMV